MKKLSIGEIWRKTHKIVLKTAQDEEKYRVYARKSGKLIYFTAEFVSKQPLVQVHLDQNNQIVHQYPPQTYDGKFGPGIILT